MKKYSYEFKTQAVEKALNRGPDVSFTEESMNKEKTLFFAGIDWGSASHQVCITDQIGSTLGEKAFNHTGKGLCEMAQWLIELSRSTADDIAVAIEVPHGPVVETLFGKRLSRSLH